MKKIIALVLLAVILVFSFAACSAKKVETTVEGTLTVGFDQNFPPMGFVDDNGEFTGFDIDLAKETAKRLKLEIALQPIKWASKDMELDSGNIDCIWNGFTINGRENDYTWTDPYMANNQVFVVRADSGITSLSDLAGKTVVVQSDSSAEKALAGEQELVNSFGDYIKSADYDIAIMDLQAGAVDAVAMDEIVANYQIEKRGLNLSVLEEKLAAEEYGVGFLLGNEALRDKVQKTLEDMAKDGTLAEISNKWFGKDITTIGK
ncbi:MAG: transporter substrate-binding domain-containing protein [Acetivibrionales bacterium]|jgi:polar amino acid transport system substrate-binding protein